MAWWTEVATFWRPGKLSEESVQIHGKPGQPCSTGRLRVGFTGARESPHINCAARRSHRERPNGRDRSEANPRPKNGPESRERWVRVAWAYCVVRSLCCSRTLFLVLSLCAQGEQRRRSISCETAEWRDTHRKASACTRW